ncbi:hypothetical protein Cfor_07826 [Coptotermes formosanus]|uniref:Biopterin-dependent aromatic amino acid hydroxylase family profile domain-containing protein n=1 Tax=Coptotermes formosanus TaxID=36987 RepID=A0A6L2P7M3_COPFO|nr:hypothetical protein Cfor_07826 [Coptotermes formosanus]
MVKQTKQCVLEEARQRSNGMSTTLRVLLHLCKLNSISALIALFVIDIGQFLLQMVYPADAELTEEEMILANAASESKEAEQTIQKAALVLRMREGIGSLARILKAIENFKGTVTHLETRASKQQGIQFDILVRVDMSRQNLLLLIRSLRQSASLGGVTLLADNSVSIKDPWFPRHASELDNCNHLMTKYEPELDMNHPGFADKMYRERRKTIAEIAFSYKHGEPIPRIDYTAEEISTWKAVFTTVLELMPKHACAEYRRVFKLLQDEGIFRPDRIPQLEEMSAFMRRHTGFTLRPAAGLLTARDFLASLAFRVFQSTQYVRHTSSPYHTPEPDCIHEMLGHMPLLADPSFAQFSQEIGLASLGASDAEIEKLSTEKTDVLKFARCCVEGERYSILQKTTAPARHQMCHVSLAQRFPSQVSMCHVLVLCSLPGGMLLRHGMCYATLALNFRSQIFATYLQCTQADYMITTSNVSRNPCDERFRCQKSAYHERVTYTQRLCHHSTMVTRLQLSM